MHGWEFAWEERKPRLGMDIQSIFIQHGEGKVSSVEALIGWPLILHLVRRVLLSTSKVINGIN